MAYLPSSRLVQQVVSYFNGVNTATSNALHVHIIELEFNVSALWRLQVHQLEIFSYVLNRTT